VVVALGTGEPVYERFFRDWAFRNPGQVAVQIRYDDALAHKVEAGSDIFLMPSRYEPCGLNQIYSLKYGTVPVVRATGGLDDTIENWDPMMGTGTGFKFAGLSPDELLAAIDRALKAFPDKNGWRRLMRNGMEVLAGFLGKIENHKLRADFLASLKTPTPLHLNVIVGAKVISQIDELPTSAAN
jgi:starch synthase